jgi:hypothetical protein
MKIYIIVIGIIMLYSCNDRNIKVEELVGTYEHLSTVPPWNGIKNIIEFDRDSVFIHWILRYDSLLLQEKGKWYYRNDFDLSTIYFDNFTSYIQYQTHDNSDKMFYGKYAIDCKKTLFGNIYLQVNIPFDPDGSPIIPKYKKVK